MEYLIIEDLFDFVFFNAIANNWRWWQQVTFPMFGDQVILEGTQESDGEDGVDFTEGCRKLEPIGTVIDHPIDNIGTEPFIVKFLHQPSSPDVF